MARPIEDIAADFDLLTARDFDYANTSANGWERLEQLCDELRAINKPTVCAPVMFHTMERLDGAELGTPGPLVHTLETWRGGYELFLVESIRRKPTPLSVWMINRILNTKPPDAETWLGLLGSVADHPGASGEAKAEARRFVEHETGA
jgi:hypothetical protein